MKKIINILSKEVINQIAAGEVIQRPASIVKELIENSIDAQAKNIEVIIKDAGKKLVQIIDDGTGMNPDDATICFHKHATSKIQKTIDIMHILTMGFRGEALASIASIADVELKTKTDDDKIGTLINIDNSKIKKNKKITTPTGTSISVKNLFFNIPARKNFLKSDKIEMKHILESFIQLSISHYKIGFKLIHNGKVIYNLSATNLKQRIIQLFGKRYNEKILPIKEKTSIVSIDGFLGNPLDARKTRGEQFLYVNNRFIKSSYLNHAIKNAMMNIITPDQHPSYFIFLTINPSTIDVNIHPNKTEVKFEDEKAIYQILKSTCKKSIGMYNITPSLDFSIEETFEIPVEIQKTLPREPKLKINKNFNPFHEDDFQAKKNTELMHQLFVNEEKNNINNIMNIDGNYALFTLIINSKQVLNLMDKKRSMQRVVYEKTIRLLKNKKKESQKLIQPFEITLNSLDIELLKEHRNTIQSLGYNINDITKKSCLVNALPAGLDSLNLKELFDHLLEELKNNNDDIKEKLIDTIAIKEAYNISNKINSFNMSNNDSLKAFINTLLDCKMPFIGIHGKPCVINIEPNLFFN